MEQISAAEYRARSADKSAGKGKTRAVSPTPRTANAEARERHAGAAVVGAGRLAWVNSQFGLPVYWRKYRLTDPAQAAALDALFDSLTAPDPAV